MDQVLILEVCFTYHFLSFCYCGSASNLCYLITDTVINKL